MELKQFINKMQQNTGLRTLLPVHQGMLYPYFSVCNGRLCAHFLTNASRITPEGMVLYTPAYHIIGCYPEADIPCIRNLKYDPSFADVDFSATTLMEKKSPSEREMAKAQMLKLTELVNDVLRQWDETGSADFSAYHQQLQLVLTEQQLQMYAKVTGCA